MIAVLDAAMFAATMLLAGVSGLCVLAIFGGRNA
jgi:hypothetical protein